MLTCRSATCLKVTDGQAWRRHNGRHEHFDPTPKRPPGRPGRGQLAGVLHVWGFQQVLVKATVAELPPVFQSAMRSVGATLLLWLWCQWRGVRLFERDGSGWAGLLVGCLFAVEFAFIYIGLQHTTASRLTVFLYTSPFWVAALVPFFIRTERLRPVQWLGMACAFAAVVFALREGFGGGGATGDLMGLAAGAL